MAITGGIKIFEKSQNLSADGASATASSGDVTANSALDKTKITRWRTLGSSDAVTETLVVTFASNKTIDRIFLLDHNFKSFTIEYDVSGVWTDFSNVVGIDGSLGSSITESTFSQNTAYYEFDSVTTGSIRLSVTTTQTVDAEKFLSQIIATSELHTFLGHPIVNRLTHSRNDRTKEMLSGKFSVDKSLESTRFKLDFKTYPTYTTGSTDYGDDFEFLDTLFDREDNFLVWLCGGRYGSTYFSVSMRGYRLIDVYEMQVTRDFRVGFAKNFFGGGVITSMDLVEAV